MAQRTKKVEEVIEPVETEIEQIQPSPQPQHPWRYRKAPKVCIVGCADSKNMAPFLDPSYEIWGVNNLFVTQLPNARYDRWFEIHNIEYNGKNWSRRESLDFRGQTVDDYVKSLARLPFPVFMQKEWSQIPNAVEYPLKEILDTFGDYFTNTISWEIALAIYLGFEEIKIVGVDMAVGTEYMHQRPSCEFFLGVAAGKGIVIDIPDEADLLKTRFLYGFGEKKQDKFAKKMKKIDSEMFGRQQKAESVMKQQEIAFHQYTGARQALGEIQKIWSNLGDTL
jgi:hypothetical protein